MFTRVVEITTKSGKAAEVANTVHEKILPILRQQTGFLDETVLTSDTESNRILALSFWKTREDAERYHREQYPKINEILSSQLESTPVIRTFNVHTSTPHKISAGKAA
jgi:heme-degrading monooxygenase HmoA